MAGFLALFPVQPILIAAITASELLHGVERAKEPGHRARGQRHVELVLANLFVQPFDLDQARCHARFGPVWRRAA